MKAKKPLKATRVLKAKKPLRAANPVMLAGKTVAFKKRRKPTPLAKKNARQLVAVADVLFSRYIRLRDSVLNDKGEWVGGCITCTRELIVRTSEGRFVASSQNGHLISRGVMQLRFNELNCNLQCAHCNAWLDKDEMIERYRKAVDYKYGYGTYKRLKAASTAPGSHKLPTKPELLQIIEDSTNQIAFYLDKS